VRETLSVVALVTSGGKKKRPCLIYFPSSDF